MSESHERLIDSAMRAFDGNAEKKLAARRWIGEQIVETDEVTMDASVSRWEEVDRRKGNGLFSRWGWIGWAVISLALLYPFYHLIRDSEDASGAFGSGSFGLPRRDLDQWINSGHRPEDKLLLGDPNESILQRKKALWDSDPEDPAFFVEYSVAFASVRNALPLDYFEIANRIDPDNVWFDYFAASMVTSNPVEASRQTDKQKAAGVAPTWAILKEKEYHAALAIIRSARGKSRFQSYENSMARRRIPLLSQGNSLERVTAISALLENSNHGRGYLFQHFFAARAWQLGESGDAQEFQELLRDFRQFVHLRTQSDDCVIIQEAVTFNVIQVSAVSLHDAAVKLGLRKEAAELEELKSRFLSYRGTLEKNRRTPNQISDLIHDHGSRIAGAFVAPLARHTLIRPPLSEAEIVPGGLADRDQILRSLWIALWSGFGIGSLMLFGYRFRAPVAVRAMACRVEKLLLPVDWIWILGVGVILPVAIFVAGWIFTPLGRERDFERAAEYFLMLGGMLILMSLLITRWRLALRAKVFNPSVKWAVGWLMVFCLPIFAAASSHEMPFQWMNVVGKCIEISEEWVNLFIEVWVAPLGVEWHYSAQVWLPRILVGLPMAWLFGVILRAVFSPHREILLRVVMSLILLVAYSVAMAAMAIAAFGFHLSQQYWFERDHLMTMTVEEPALSPYEYRVAKQKRLETRELLRNFGP